MSEYILRTRADFRTQNGYEQYLQEFEEYTGHILAGCYEAEETPGNFAGDVFEYQVFSDKEIEFKEFLFNGVFKLSSKDDVYKQYLEFVAHLRVQMVAWFGFDADNKLSHTLIDDDEREQWQSVIVNKIKPKGE